MKRFIVISFLTAVAVKASACIWGYSYNNYLFSPCDTQEFSDRVGKVCDDNWKTYLGSTDSYYYFDADEIVKVAQKKNDALMISYVENLKKYLKCASDKRYDAWEYPSKQQLEERRQMLMAVRSYAQGKLTSRLRSQHALLFMRCNMMLDRHAENVTFWQQTGSKLIETVYRDMMRNIYAGALLNTGKDREATRIFAEQADWSSLMTIYYKLRSCKAIGEEYHKDPKSPVLPFLLKDFVNNAQEAIDARNQDDYYGGKLFIRKIQRQEAMQMCQLCQQVVSERKTDVPALWQSAKAWLEYMFGERNKGIADIQAAEAMQGTQRMKENVRVLKFYMMGTLSRSGERLDNYVAGELQWLQKKGADDSFFEGALERIAHQVLIKRYAAYPSRHAALMAATGCDEYHECLDTMRVEALKRYVAYVGSPAKNKLDRYLKPKQKIDQAEMNDLTGTKYMRLCRWDEAQQWLQKVPLSFYGKQGYAVYAYYRKWNIEPWRQRQWIKDNLEWSNRRWQLNENPKLAFAREMQALTQKAKVAQGSALQQCCYDLAVRYAQASITGDCWFLMRNGKSIGDVVRRNETDFCGKAAEMLRKVAATTDFKQKEKALYALSYVYLYPTQWYETEWSDKENKMVRKPMTKTAQWQAFANLTKLEKQNAGKTSDYVSRCDEYRQFLKFYR